MTPNPAADALLAFVPGSLAGDLRNTFAQMEVAEEEIERIRRHHPDRSAYLNKVGFLLCMPSPVLFSAAEWIYRAHCREILERVAEDEDTREATAAELAVAFSETSLKSPLTPTGSGLYARYFLRAAELVDQEIEPEHAEALREMDRRLEPALARPLLHDARRELLQKARKPKMTLRQFERLTES